MKNVQQPLSNAERRAIAKILGINVLTDEAQLQGLTQVQLDAHWDLMRPKTQSELLIEWLAARTEALTEGT